MKRSSIKNIIISSISLLGILVGGLIPYNFTYAKRSFVLSPMSQRIMLVPGEAFVGSISIANPADSDEDFNYIVDKSPFYPVNKDGNDYGDVTYSERNDMNMIIDWTTLEDEVGTLAPDETKEITFTIDVPIDAPAGGQYMALLVRENVEKQVIEGSATITEIMQMSHIVYAEVIGETRKEGSILENNVPSFVTNSELTTTSMVRNDGNVHTDAEYILQVWPLFSDEEICTNAEKPNSVMILPNTQRYNSQSCKLPSVGVFRVRQTVKIFGEESVVEKTIIVCPIWLLFIILFVIILFVIWIFTRTKSKKSSKKAEN